MQAGGPSKQEAIRNLRHLLIEETRDNSDYKLDAPSRLKESKKKVTRVKKFVERVAGQKDVSEACVVAISFLK